MNNINTPLSNYTIKSALLTSNFILPVPKLGQMAPCSKQGLRKHKFDSETHKNSLRINISTITVFNVRT